MPLHGDVSNIHEGLQNLSLGSSSSASDKGGIVDRATPAVTRGFGSCGLSYLSHLQFYDKQEVLRTYSKRGPPGTAYLSIYLYNVRFQ